MKKQVMMRAWEIVRKAIKTFGGKAMEYIGEAIKMAWAEVKAAAETVFGGEFGKITESAIEKLIAMGANRWTKYGKDRLYLRRAGDKLMGLKCSYYKSGNVSYAELNGEEISHAEAHRIGGAYADAYIDLATGSICDTHGRYAEAFKEAVRAYMI